MGVGGVRARTEGGSGVVGMLAVAECVVTFR